MSSRELLEGVVVTTADRPIPKTSGQRADDWDRGEVIPWWLVILVVALLVSVVGLGSYMLYARYVGRSLDAATITDVEKWQSEVKADSSDVKAQVALGHALQREARFEDAVKAFDTALKLDKRNIGALYNRGVCLLELGRKAEAAAAFRSVLEVAPKHALAAAALGQYYIDTREYEMIVPAVSEASAANPGLADLHAMLGVAHEKAGEIEGARDEYETAIRLSPELSLAKEGLARLKGQ